MVTAAFAFAGRASFVIENPRGESLTVRLVRARPKTNPYTGKPYAETFFVSLRHNNAPWVYAGRLDASRRLLVRSTNPLPGDEPRTVRIVEWALKLIHAGTDVPQGYRLSHTGHCGKCGKLLRDAASIACGLGPVCRA